MKYPYFSNTQSIVIGIIILFTVSLSSCTHKIVRENYKVTKEMYNKVLNQNITFIYRDYAEDTSIKILGQVKLKESGFSTKCDETRAFEILKKEANAISANLVIIEEERLPNMASSCYRCTASLCIADTNTIHVLKSSNEIITQDEINEKGLISRKKQSSMVYSGIMSGVIGGLVAGLLSILKK